MNAKGDGPPESSCARCLYKPRGSAATVHHVTSWLVRGRGRRQRRTKRKGFVRDEDVFSRRLSLFQKTARIRICTSVPSCVCTFQRPPRTPNRSTGCPVLPWSERAARSHAGASPSRISLRLGRSAGRPARAHPSNPASPRPSVKWGQGPCQRPWVTVGAE